MFIVFIIWRQVALSKIDTYQIKHMPWLGDILIKIKMHLQSRLKQLVARSRRLLIRKVNNLSKDWHLIHPVFIALMEIWLHLRFIILISLILTSDNKAICLKMSYRRQVWDSNREAEIILKKIIQADPTIRK